MDVIVVVGQIQWVFFVVDQFVDYFYVVVVYYLVVVVVLVCWVDGVLQIQQIVVGYCCSGGGGFDFVGGRCGDNVGGLVCVGVDGEQVVGDLVQVLFDVVVNECFNVYIGILDQFDWYGDYFGVEFVYVQCFGIEVWICVGG